MRHYKEKHIYVGVDLHKHTHTAVVINCWNEKLGEIQFNNFPNAFPDFLQQTKGEVKMNLEWYLFEHSYLTGIEYNPRSCSLILKIDAKITFEHPESTGINNLEDSFVEVTVLFEGVQYLRLISSLNLLTNPNDDIGSIEQFHLKDSKSIRMEN